MRAVTKLDPVLAPVGAASCLLELRSVGGVNTGRFGKIVFFYAVLKGCLTLYLIKAL